MNIKSPRRFLQRLAARQAARLLAASFLLSVTGTTVRAGTEVDVAPGAPANSLLNAPGTYTNNAVPDATNDVTFTNTAYTAGSFQSNTNIAFGSLNDLATTAITINTSNGSTTNVITLGGGTNSVAPNAADLLYVATGSSLSFVGSVAAGTGVAGRDLTGIALAASGNFDVAGTLSVVGPISGSFGFNKAGAGTMTLSGGTGTGTGFPKANTYTGATTISAGTLQLTANANINSSSGLTLGDATVGANATFTVGGGLTVSTPISVAAGTGTRLVNFSSGSATSTFSSPITLQTGSTLTLRNAASASGAVAFTTSGGITGTGDVVVSNTKAGAGYSTIFSTNAVNNAGTVTNASTASGALTQTSGGILGLSVTQFVQNSATSNTTFSQANFNQSTSVQAGTLLTTGTGTLGAGNVTVGAGTLTLASSVSFADNAILNFTAASTINLNNAAADTLANIIDTDTGSAPLTAGTTYNATQLNAAFGVSSFSGAGSLTIAVVPEPGAWVGILLGLGVLGFRQRCRSATARQKLVRV